MPRRSDLQSILVVGSGPIVIGQACEFDYSGTQACRVLRQEGYRVILANSNPATIMTDPELADRTYIEPLDADTLAAIVARERPDAVLATMGGQTALNLAVQLASRGVLEEFGVELIGAKLEAIRTAENRDRFKEAMEDIGLEVPESGLAHDMEEAFAVAGRIGFPLIVRPSFILGGAGTAIADDAARFRELAARGLEASPVHEILVERSIAGWKEFELEVMRDCADNCVVVCSIENFDPMGVHTGDSITVAPAQTLSDVEYQRMRDAAFDCIRRVGVETGGSNIQFAVDPKSGAMLVIEMNPRVSRSSALASKATGFPIAKIAARLAVGYRLEEISNDITKATPACFEPTIDYVVTKVPRWAFEKLPGAATDLGARMQSVGEAMAIGRTFPESLQKALRGLETGRDGLNSDRAESRYDSLGDDELLAAVAVATPERPFLLEAALRRGFDVETLAGRSSIDPWFVSQIALITSGRARLEAAALEGGVAALKAGAWRRAKRLGFSDAQIACLFGTDETLVREARLRAGVRPTFKTVDTCGAEFAAETPYYYATYEDEDEVRPGRSPRVVILGSGPNRIGQGIEFDYCCVHASLALREAGYETVMVNCNPETVSTDYDTSDRLYFEPVTFEAVADIVEAESAGGAGGVAGVVVSLGGQTPLKLADRFPAGLVLGTTPASIDIAEDRERWAALCARLEIPQPAGGTASSAAEARRVTAHIGYPALVRPSYVLGGRAMEIVYDDGDLDRVVAASLSHEGPGSPPRPVLIDRFLEDATEVDVDAVRDSAGEVLIGAVMEHVEEAGVHSGDSACVIPPPTLGDETVSVIEDYTRRIAAALEVVGPLNVQFAVKQGQVFVLEANPRASRTVPFVAKATGLAFARLAARTLVGTRLSELRSEGVAGRSPGGRPGHVSVKEAVLPFDRFPDVDTLLGPEMRSTGEVMGIDRTFGLAFAKSQIAAGSRLPASGTVFLSLADRDKEAGVGAALAFVGLGFSLAATEGTADFLEARGIPVDTRVGKLTGAGEGVDAVELISSGKIQLVVNTPRGRGSRADGAHIRRAASRSRVPCLTTAAAARAAAAGIADWGRHRLEVRSLQEHHSPVVSQPSLFASGELGGGAVGASEPGGRQLEGRQLEDRQLEGSELGRR
jgi:carbamoyl-phosphate synthase large subunit